jgi:hypothetical protein
VRAITFFSGERFPVFLITVFGKSQKVNLSRAERNALRSLTEQIVRAYQARIPILVPGENP